MSFTGRLSTAIGLFLVAVGLIVWSLLAFLHPGLNGGYTDYAVGHTAGTPVDVTMQSVGQIGFGKHPTWVSYLQKDPTTGQWIHDTSMTLPADSVVHMTIYQYDSGGPLRNQQWGQVTGTIGNDATVNGKIYKVYDSNTGNGIGHPFAVPGLNVAVPLVAVSSSATNVCSAAPCGTNSVHNVITFSFKTGAPGSYNWQCFVPCGLGYLYGNGGPMSTINYMGGFLKVVA
jgi:hypothetical protein